MTATESGRRSARRTIHIRRDDYAERAECGTDDRDIMRERPV